MNEALSSGPGHMIGKLRILMISRVAIVSLLLVLPFFGEIKDAGMWPVQSLLSFYTIIIIVYILSIAYLPLLRYLENVRINVYIQAICDVLLIGALVHVTGGAQSVYTVFYPLVIIYSVLFLGRTGGVGIASACSALYASMLGLEFYGIVSPAGFFTSDYPLPPGFVSTRILAHVLSFYIIAFLASFVVEQEKKTRLLLAEKENAFGRLDQLHRSIIESVDAGIITINLQGNIKSFNRAAGEITGYGPAEVANINIGDIFPGFQEQLEKMSRQGGRTVSQRRVEVTVRGKNGDTLLLGSSVSPLRDNQERRIGEIIIFQDMTTIKEMEDSLEKSRRLAFIGEMAANLAHEIRNPLAAISGSVQVLSQELNLNGADQKLMQIILRSKDQLETFMRDFLLLARPHSSVYEKTDMKGIIDDVLQSVRYGQDWHEGIEVAWERVAPDTTIEANSAELRQLMGNLLLNASQSMPEGGRLTIGIDRVSPPASDAHLEICIRDTGTGIEAEDMKNIFEPFYTTKEKGTGLGLAIVNKIIAGHGGEIHMESRLREGTTCIVRLPLSGGRR